MSEEEKVNNKTSKNEEEKKNLETIDFSDIKDKIQSPYSKKAILELELHENKDKEKYLLNHTELKMHHQKYKIKDMNIIIKEEKNKLNQQNKKEMN